MDECMNQLHSSGKFKGEILTTSVSKRTAHRISSHTRSAASITLFSPILYACLCAAFQTSGSHSIDCDSLKSAMNFKVFLKKKTRVKLKLSSHFSISFRIVLQFRILWNSYVLSQFINFFYGRKGCNQQSALNKFRFT